MARLCVCILLWYVFVDCETVTGKWIIILQNNLNNGTYRVMITVDTISISKLNGTAPLSIFYNYIKINKEQEMSSIHS